MLQACAEIQVLQSVVSEDGLPDAQSLAQLRELQAVLQLHQDILRQLPDKLREADGSVQKYGDSHGTALGYLSYL